MRVAHLALAAMLGLAAGVPAMAPTAMAQTALPGVVPTNRPVAPPNAPGAAMTMSPKAMPSTAAKIAPVNINTATEAQLDAIPQIGEKRAAAIIKNRPYRSVQDLVTKKALTSGIFDKVKKYLTV